MSLTLAAPLAVSAALAAAVFVLLWLDRYRNEPLPWMAAVAAAGLAAPSLLLIAGSRLPELLRAPGAGGPLPELWLAPVPATIGLLLLGIALPLGAAARTRVLEGPAAGAAFGVVAGLAFSIGTEILLLVRTPWRPGGSALAFVCVLHAAVGAAFGAGVGLTRLAARPALRVPGVLAAAAGAAGLGALLGVAAVSCWTHWGEGSVACNLALTGVGAAVILAIFSASFSYERGVLTAQLVEEVELGVLPAWVAEIVPSYARRTRSDWWPRRDERREILRLLVTMAFRKHRLRALPEDRVRLYGLEVGRLRHRARVLLSDGAAIVRPEGAQERGDPVSGC